VNTVEASKAVSRVAIAALLCVALAACGTRPPAAPPDGVAPVSATGLWFYFTDADNDGGSSTIGMELTEENGTAAFHFAGEVTSLFRWGFAGFGLEPDETTLELLRLAESVSFMVRGDGQRYSIQLVTDDVTDNAFFWFLFDTVADRPVRVTVPMRMFVQPDWTEQPVGRLRRELATGLQWQTHESWRPGTFELTVWDVRLYVPEADAARISTPAAPAVGYLSAAPDSGYGDYGYEGYGYEGYPEYY